ncbi:MAG: hypothetical protein R3B06_08630 [Kofleriaceae bacterium]
MKAHTLLILGSLVVATAGCKKSDSSTPAPAPAPGTAAPAPTPDPAAEAAAARQKVADRLAKLDAEVATEAARWTPELEAQVVALRDGDYATPVAALTAILASPHRLPGNAARDQYRHPLETLTFFGVEPTSRVVELGTGAGWYTEILAPLLAKRGALTAVGPNPDGPDDKMSRFYGQRLVKMLGKSAALYGAVTRVAIDPPGTLTLGPPGSADVVIAFREMHNWVGAGQLAAYLTAIHAVLKDGGTFAFIDHRSAPDAKVEAVVEQGYLPEPWVIAQVTAAGFDLVAQAEINANPKDTKDYKEGVWTLPPALALGEVDRDKYTAIGESDRMTLKFVKRAGGAAPAVAAPPSAK